MQLHEGYDREPDPGDEKDRRQRAMTIAQLLVIVLLIGALTLMLLERFFS
jgi:hypothetical protein